MTPAQLRFAPDNADGQCWVPAVGRNGVGEPEAVVLQAVTGPFVGTLMHDPLDPSEEIMLMSEGCPCCSWQHAPRDRAPESIGSPTTWRAAHEQAEARVRELADP